MDKKKSKKIRNARIIATNIFMTISVIAIVFVLTLIAMGFTFNESGNLEQSGGLVQISSHPSGATVEIDKVTQFSHTEINKMLKAGAHEIKISKPGYDTWETNLEIDAGLLNRIEWVRLFPLTPKIETAATYKKPALVSSSPDHKYLAIIATDATTLNIFDLQSGNDERTVKLDLAKILSITPAEGSAEVKIPTDKLVFHDWSGNDSKLILEQKTDTTPKWYIVDLSDENKTIDLTKSFGINFDRVLAANDSATRLWATSEGNLYSIDTTNKTISNIIASNIISIANNSGTVAFISKTTETIATEGEETTETKDSYLLKTYRDGEKAAAKVTDLTELYSTENHNSNIVMGTYWGDEWIGYYVGKKAVVLSGRYPSGDKKESKPMKALYDVDLEYYPETIARNDGQRIIVFRAGQQNTSFDVENKKTHNITSDTTVSSINWLDNFILVENTHKQVVVRDFTGENRRELITNLDNDYPVVVSGNNRYLYYFSIIEDQKTIPSTTDNDETQTEVVPENAKEPSYELKREELNI